MTASGRGHILLGFWRLDRDVVSLKEVIVSSVTIEPWIESLVLAKKTVKKTSKTKRAAPASASRSSSAAGSTRKTARAAKTAKAKATDKKAVKARKAARPAKTAGRAAKASSKPRSTRPKRTRSPRGPATAPAAKQPAAAHRGTIAATSERPLTPTETENFRQMLLQKRAEIVGDVSTLQNEALNRNRQDAAGDLSSMPIHMADLGSDNFELEFTLGLIEGERAILKEIDEALERIQRKTYGFCLATGNPIGKARLRAKPWAKYCYEYTLAQEKGQGRGS